MKRIIVIAIGLFLIGLTGASCSFAGDTIKVGFVDT